MKLPSEKFHHQPASQQGSIWEGEATTKEPRHQQQQQHSDPDPDSGASQHGLHVGRTGLDRRQKTGKVTQQRRNSSRGSDSSSRCAAKTVNTEAGDV